MIIMDLLRTFKGEHGISETASQLPQIAVLTILMVIITFLGRLKRPAGPPAGAADRSRRTGHPWVALGAAVARRQLGHLVPRLLVMGLMLVCFSRPRRRRHPRCSRHTSVTFNLFVSAFGGTTAIVVSGLVLASGDPELAGYYLIAAGVVGAVSAYFLKESNGRPLRVRNRPWPRAGARELIANRS